MLSGFKFHEIIPKHFLPDCLTHFRSHVWLWDGSEAYNLRLPLFLWLRDLFQSAAGFLQLSQGVGRRQGWHGWVLNERVARVVAAEVRSTADATPTPGRMRAAGQHLGVKRVGLL